MEKVGKSRAYDWHRGCRRLSRWGLRLVWTIDRPRFQPRRRMELSQRTLARTCISVSAREFLFSSTRWHCGRRFDGYKGISETDGEDSDDNVSEG